MTVFTERNSKTILSAVVDADNDPLSVTKINGQAALLGVPIPLAVGGAVTVTADGAVTFDDTGFDIPEIGDFVSDGLIATISDGTEEVDTAVNLELYGALATAPVILGALTRPFEGGTPAPEGATAITGGDPNGFFAVADGMILPTAAGSGAMSGTYTLTFDTGDIISLVVLEDTFSVANDAEVQGLLGDAAQPYDGKTVLFRPGQYGVHLVPPVTLNEGFTFRGEKGAVIDRINVRNLTGNPTVTFKDLTFKPPVPEDKFSARLYFERNTTPNGTLIIEDCWFEGHSGIDPASDDWFAKIDYTGATGSFVIGETVTGTNNGAISLTILNVVDNGNGTGTLWINDSPSRGDGGSIKGDRVDAGVLLTGDGSATTATATGKIYGGVLGVGNGVLIQGPVFQEVYMRNCVGKHLGSAFVMSAPKVLEITDTVCDECREDFLKFLINGDDRPSERLHIKRNLHMRPFGNPEDYGNPHVDGVQFLFGNMTLDLPNLEITDNIFMLGGRTTSVQGLFITQGSGNGVVKDGVIANNILANGLARPIRADRWHGGAFRNNVAPYLSGGEHFKLTFLVGDRLADPNTVYDGNIVEGISYFTANNQVGGPSFDPPGNYTPGSNPDWSLVYDNLTGQAPVDVSDLLTQLTPKASSLIMAGTTWNSGSDMGCVTDQSRFIAHDGTDLTDHMLALEARALGVGNTAFVGSDVDTITVNDFPVDAWPYDLRAVYGENTARIPVSGTITPALENISVRARQAGSTGPGQVIGQTASDGSFSGHMTTAETGQAHQLEVFVDGDLAVSAITTNTYATGNHIVMWTQSELHNPFHQVSNLAAPNLLDPGNMIFVSMDNHAATETAAPDPMIVTLADPAATVAMKYMANVYAQAAPGKKFVVIDCMEAGTSMFDMMDEDNLKNPPFDRNFVTADKVINDYIRDTIGDTPSFNYYCWWAADQARFATDNLDRFGDVAAPYFFLETREGATINLGDDHPLDASDTLIGDVDHTFYDNAAAPGERGAGLYAADEAKFMFAVNGFMNSVDPMASFEPDAVRDNPRQLSDNLNHFLGNDQRATARGFMRGFDMNLPRLGNFSGSTWSDPTHPSIHDRHGSPLMLETVALSHLKAMGIVTAAEPEITSTTWSESDVTVSVDVGLGNRLTTYRNELGLGPVDAETWRAEISGFEFMRDTTYDHPGAGAVTITDDGAATGIATITIARSNANGDQLTFNTGGATGCLNNDDMLDGYMLNQPAVKLAGIEAPMIALKRNPKDASLIADLDSTPAGPVFVALNDTQYTDTQNLAASDRKLTFDFLLNLPVQSTAHLMRVKQSGVNRYVSIEVLSARRLRVLFVDGSALVNFTTANFTLPENTDMNLRCVLDYDEGRVMLLLDDVEYGSASWTPAADNNPTGPVQLMGHGSEFVDGNFSHTRLYKGANADNSLTGLTLYKEATAPAINANAPVGWSKSGGDVSDI